jgi:Domain of unknown function (DUF1906)
VLAFLGAWTAELHAKGYASGVYSSSSSGITDLVSQYGTDYTEPDVLFDALWNGAVDTDDPAIPAADWADHQRVHQYAGNVSETYGGATVNIDRDYLDVGAPAPQQQATTLTYTGPATVADGSAAHLAAVLKDDSGAPVSGRTVSFALGTGSTAQSCTGTTDSAGQAACDIAAVDQPLTDAATAPVAVAFAGDSAYLASSTSATVTLRYVTGRAYGLSADVPLPLLPIDIAPTPDTGTLRTATAADSTPGCASGVNTLLITADALCARTSASVDPTTDTSTATLSDATIGLVGLPVITVSGIAATATSGCTGASGGATLSLSVGGVPVTVPTTPNAVIDVAGGVRLVVDEQTPVAGADHGITVNALHLTGVGGIDVVLGSTTSAAYNCG